jgi:uncharacterized protein (UPF0548 family)
MYFVKRPAPAKIKQVITSAKDQPFSYPAVEATTNGPVPGYVIDHNRIKLGYGAAAYEQAKVAIRRWQMFRLGWVELCWPDTPIEVGATVGVLVNLFGLWSLNLCRIVYVIEENGPVERFGFAYGTLPEHAERGEERFSVEWRHQDDSVWYDILAFSRPNQWLVRLGYPLARRLQKRFAAGSKRVMKQAVNHSPPIIDK